MLTLFAQVLPDVGIQMQDMVQQITGVWFGLVAQNLGFIFVGAIIWTGTAMFERRLIGEEVKRLDDFRVFNHTSPYESKQLRKLGRRGDYEAYDRLKLKIAKREGVVEKGFKG